MASRPVGTSAERWEAAVCKALNLTIAADGPMCQRLNAIADDLRAKQHERAAELETMLKTRDGIKERIRRLVDLVEGGDAPAKQVVARLGALEGELEEATMRIAELEGLTAAAGVDAGGIETLVQELRLGFANLDTKPAEEQHRVLHSQLAEVHIGFEKSIKLVFWLPDLVAVGDKCGSAQTQESKEPVPTGVSPSGHGFAWRSKMVEAPGIEPGSGTVRAALLRA